MIEGSSANAIFDCSGGKLIPGKHLLLCLIVKSLTGSKTIVSFNLFQCGLGGTQENIEIRHLSSLLAL